MTLAGLALQRKKSQLMPRAELVQSEVILIREMENLMLGRKNTAVVRTFSRRKRGSLGFGSSRSVKKVKKTPIYFFCQGVGQLTQMRLICKKSHGVKGRTASHDHQE